jgi:hypothetical protein
MKNTMKLFSFVLVTFILVISCSIDPESDTPGNTNYAISKIVHEGKTVTQFLYTKTGKLAEYQSFYFCDRYTYDDNDRLVTSESASGSGSFGRENLMTSENSTFTLYYTYEYDQDGLLKCRMNYKQYDGVYEFLSKNNYEYQDGKIYKINTLNAKDTIINFAIYAYDVNGNVTNEKHYSNIYIDGPEAALQYEFSYKFDNKNNPFRIFKETAQPGLYTDANNRVERSSTFYYHSQGTNNFSTSIMSYDYNSKGFPVKITEGNTVYNYVYN